VEGAIASGLIALSVAIIGLIIIWLTPPGDSKKGSR
jgi:hypothetical protein